VHIIGLKVIIILKVETDIDFITKGFMYAEIKMMT
jgi:hypothetical protein